MRPLVATLALCLVTAACDAAPSTEPAARALPLAAVEGGGVVVPKNRQYDELSAVWWQYAMSLAQAQNPLYDATGAKALNGQPYDHRNVIFLSGSLDGAGRASRTVTVSPGTRLFFPVMTIFWGCIASREERQGLVDAVVAASGMSPQVVAALPDVDLERRYVNLLVDAIDPASLSVTIDGIPVANVQSYRAQSAAFTIPSTALWGTPDEPCPGAVTAGYWQLLNPLPPGDHTLHFTASLDSPIFGSFAQDIRYLIHVVPGLPNGGS